MVRYNLPEGMRYATLEERKSFYRKEFDLKKVAKWLENWIEPVIFAVVIGRHTKVFPKKYREDSSTTIIIDDYEDLMDVKNWIIEFVPESVYYDRNIYGDGKKIIGQELAFDLDPENIDCPIHGSLGDRIKKKQGLSFCKLELKLIKEQTKQLFEELSRTFSKIKIVYSGRGFHIHVFDKITYDWNYTKRQHFAEKMKNKGFPIDQWVTSGSMRLIRLPYSLHGMVSRIVVPLNIGELRDFDPITDEKCKPGFLKPNSTSL